MKKNIIIIFLFAHTILLFGQKQEDVNLLETDNTWRKEIFNFPIPFAKEIDFEGIADVRFPKGWEDVKSHNFWSYAFGWNISLNKKLTEEALEKCMQIYFDGLMNVVNKEKKKEIPNTIALFTVVFNSDGKISYKGKIKIFDAFFTKKTLLLNVIVDYFYCKQKNKSMILFKLSPKKMENDLWLDLKKIKFRNNICSLTLYDKK